MRFQPLTPVNTLLYTGKMPMNKRKTSCLQCVNRAVNAGKWFVYLHLPLGRTTVKWYEYWDSPMRKRTENVGFSERKTWVNVCKMSRLPWIQSSFSVRWTLVFLPWWNKWSFICIMHIRKYSFEQQKVKNISMKTPLSMQQQTYKLALSCFPLTRDSV